VLLFALKSQSHSTLLLILQQLSDVCIFPEFSVVGRPRAVQGDGGRIFSDQTMANEWTSPSAPDDQDKSSCDVSWTMEGWLGS
jgi:hypothetical protein